MSSVVGATGVSAQAPAIVPAAQSAAAQSPAASSTPLLDAAIQRVEALTRQQRESLSSADTPDEAEKKPTWPSPGSTSVQPAKTAEFDPPLPIVLARSGESPGSAEAAERQISSPSQLPPGPRASTESSRKRGDPPPDRSLENPPASLSSVPRESKTSPGDPEGPAAELSQGPMPPTETRESSKNPTAALRVGAGIVPTGPTREENSPLNVANLQLCRKVYGFGSFESVAGTTVRPGQRVLLYCEMTGLQYEGTDAGFASRLSSRVELRAADNETVLWEQELGIARDVCPRVRHDYYVSYRVTIPPSLPAGPHRLRVVQTDLAANRSASSEILLTIVP